MVKETIPQNICNSWKLQKFHDLLHVSRDMFMFGSPQNWDASPVEHNLMQNILHKEHRNDTVCL